MSHNTRRNGQNAQDADGSEVNGLEAVLRQLAENQRQQQEQFVAHQVQVAEAQRLQAEQTERLMMELTRSSDRAIVATNAKALAGEPPKFEGRIQDIEVARWVSSYENWCMLANVNGEVEMLACAPASFKDKAIQWWMSLLEEARRSSTRPFNTWTEMKEAMMKKFLAQDPAEFAREHVARLISKKNTNIIAYNNEYAEYDSFVTDRAESDRLYLYIGGLPEDYTLKIKDKKLKTVKEAMELAVTLFNVRRSHNGASSSSRTATIDVNQMDTEMEDASSSSSSIASESTPGAPQPSTSDAMLNRLEQLARAVDGLSNKVYGSDSRGGYRGGFNRGGSARGRQRGGRGGSQGDRSRGRSQSPSKYELLEKAMWEKYRIHRNTVKERYEAKQCIKCGESNHMAWDCKNETKN